MLIGFEKQKKYFKQILKHGVLSHAYIFAGPEYIGKKQFALDLCALANGRSHATDPDFKFFASDPAMDKDGIYIENIREMISFLSLKPMLGPYKLAVIDNADRMTPEAANAMLKVLEEPPPFSVIILISARPRMLMPTIASRCLTVHFALHDKKDIAGALAGRKLSPADADLLTLLAGGRIGWILSHADGDSSKMIKKNIAEFQSVMRQGLAERLEYAKKIADPSISSGQDLAETVDLWVRWVRAHGKDQRKTVQVLHNLLSLAQLVSQPQYNHRLALENFLIAI